MLIVCCHLSALSFRSLSFRQIEQFDNCDHTKNVQDHQRPPRAPTSISQNMNNQAPWPVRKGIFRSSGQSDFIPTRSPSPIVEMPLSPPPVSSNSRASSISRFDNNCPLSPPPQPVQVILGPPGPAVTTSAASTLATSSKSAQSSSSSSTSSSSSGQRRMSQSAAASTTSASNSSATASASTTSSNAAATSGRMSQTASSSSSSSASRTVRKESSPSLTSNNSITSSSQSTQHSHNGHQTRSIKSTTPPKLPLKNVREIPIEVEQNQVRSSKSLGKTKSKFLFICYMFSHRPLPPSYLFLNICSLRF